MEGLVKPNRKAYKETAMDQISDAAEAWLRLLHEEFGYELGNQAIQSEHVKYPSATAAELAMLRKAYLRGRQDAQLDAVPQLDFQHDVERVNAVNRKSSAHLGAVGGE